MSGIRGRYPGGPSREGAPGDGEEPRDPVRLASVGEIEARAAEGSLRYRRRRRRRRALYGLLLSLLVAGAAGLWLGLESHRTAEEAAERLRQERSRELDLRREADRLISELWKMEELERAPRPPGR